MDTIVKKLNEIADAVAGEDVEDATNVADALVDIGNAFAGSEGEKTNSVVEALDYIKENVSGGGSLEFYNVEISFATFEEDEPLLPMAYYDGENNLYSTILALSTDGTYIEGRYPVIDGVCKFILNATNFSVFELGEDSDGVSYEHDEVNNNYIFTIEKDNAILNGIWAYV